MINEKLYDKLKFLALVLLPSFSTLYFALAGIWGLPAAEQVTGTIVALDTFLGVVLHISSIQYNKAEGNFDGVVHVGEENEDGLHDVRISGISTQAKDILDKKELRLKVNPTGQK